MPYIIHSIAGTGDGWPCNTPSGFAETHFAVRTLEEAQAAAAGAVESNARTSLGFSDNMDDRERYADLMRAAQTIPESGGTIELPDDTMIEVQRVSWFDIAKVTIEDADRAFYNATAAGLPKQYPGVAQSLCDDYNAHHAD